MLSVQREVITVGKTRYFATSRGWRLATSEFKENSGISPYSYNPWDTSLNRFMIKSVNKMSMFVRANVVSDNPSAGTRRIIRVRLSKD
jgi:hypothetical protein